MNVNADIKVHLIDNRDNRVLLRKVVSHAPRIGDEVRLGGEGTEKYYRVILVVWVYDEPDCPFDRVNVGVELCSSE